MGLEGIRIAFSAVFVLSYCYSFVILLPDIGNALAEACVSCLKTNYCYHITGIEGAYRITFTNFQYHWIFTAIHSIQRACCNTEEPTWNISLCILATIGFPGLLAFSIVVPSSIILYEALYYTFLLNAIAFVFLGFKMTLNIAWSWKVLIIDESIKLRNKPTCYICTWLFLLHLTSSLLYALSLDIILAFFFFNNVYKCGTTLLFLIINLILCITAAVLSYLPPLRQIRASSQIIISMMTFYVMLITWVALSDPENNTCNLYGTVFSGSNQVTSLSTRSITGLALSLFFIIMNCFKNEQETYITTIALSNSGLEFYWGGKSYPSGFHITLATGATFTLMSLTNWYVPEFRANALVLVHGGIKKVDKAILILGEFSWLRFLLLCITSTLLPLSYIILLVCYICRIFLFPNENNSLDKDQKQNSNSNKCEVPSVIIMSEKECTDILTKVPSLKISDEALPSIEEMLLPCYCIESTGIRYWHFPKLISQAYYGGRNGSNACTIIAVVIGRLFSRSSIQLNESGYLPQDWIQLCVSSITEGNELYDEIIKKFGVLDLSIEEAVEAFGKRLNVKRVEQSLPVSFASDTYTATVLYQLSGIVNLSIKQVVLFIHKQRTGAFLVYPNRSVVYVDSHAHGDRGAILIWSRYDNLRQMVALLRDIMPENENRLSTLTVVKYETRNNLIPIF